MPDIHPTAIIAETAKLADGVRIGPFAVIENDVVIGSGCEIAAHAVIKQFTVMGARNRVAEHAVLGGLPQDTKFGGEESRLVIGDDNLIREFATLHRASGTGAETRVGSRNFLMIGVHIAHNCSIGDDNIMANGVALAGHIMVEDHAFLASNVGGHQFVRIGRYAMVGGKSKVVQDILPFCITDGNPPYLSGLNSVGLRRAGFDQTTRENLKRAYRILFRSKLPFADALTEAAGIDDPNVAYLLSFIRDSKRGFHRPARLALAGAEEADPFRNG